MFHIVSLLILHLNFPAGKISLPLKGIQMKRKYSTNDVKVHKVNITFKNYARKLKRPSLHARRAPAISEELGDSV